MHTINVQYIQEINFKMIKKLFKITLITLLILFLSISPRTRYLLGITFKQVSVFLFWTVRYEERQKWIIDKPNWIKKLKI